MQVGAGDREIDKPDVVITANPIDGYHWQKTLAVVEVKTSSSADLSNDLHGQVLRCARGLAKNRPALEEASRPQRRPILRSSLQDFARLRIKPARRCETLDPAAAHLRTYDDCRPKSPAVVVVNIVVAQTFGPAAALENVKVAKVVLGSSIVVWRAGNSIPKCLGGSLVHANFWSSQYR